MSTRMDRFMYILVVLAYNSYSSLCIQPEVPRIYQNSEVPTSHQNFQIQIKELRYLAIIKANILRRLGIMDPPMRPIVPPLTTKPPPMSKVMAFRSRDITRILSEVPATAADTHTIQFELSDISSDHRTVIDIVNLLVRLKYKKKRKQKSLDFQSVKSSNKNNIDLTKKSKKDRRRKQSLEIKLTVSNVKHDGKQGTVLTSVKSRLKKTKTLQLTLQPSILVDALNSDSRTLQLHIVCGGCGRRAALILLHKHKKRKRAKGNNTARSLHKRRPVLLIQTHKSVPS
ncbi:uncharacterized protein LOC128231921 isoform X1 [Mya arenaria]|uniref:uncharacterized protein LOC128231921 isoform X1 n=1 Tax=Mya arenaria TaxID=6604 RepID=UPI0022E42FC8|nr:uncharacterized protein LOC128231921 isoform X1 [Mya arenaria]